MSQIILPPLNNSISCFRTSPPLQDFPKDILRRIFTDYSLTYKDVVHFASTCRNAVYLTSDSDIGSYFLHKDFPDSGKGFKFKIKDINFLDKLSLTFYKLITIANQNIRDGKYSFQEEEVENPRKKILQRFSKEDHSTNQCIFHGNYFIAYTMGTFQIYDLNSGLELPFGKLIRKFVLFNRKIISQVVACDNKLVVCFNDLIKIYDLNIWQELFTIDEILSFKKKFVLACDSKLLIKLGDFIKIYDLNTFEELITIDVSKINFTDKVLIDNNKLIITERLGNKIYIINLHNGEELIIEHPDFLILEAQVCDNKVILPMAGKVIFIHDLDSGEELLRFQIPAPLLDISIYDQKLIVLVGSEICVGSEIHIYDLNSGKKLQTFEDANISSFKFDNYQLRITHSNDEIIHVLDFNDPLLSRLSNSPQFEHLQIVPEEEIKENISEFEKIRELQKRGFEKKDTVCNLLQNLCAAVEKKLSEIEQSSALLKEYNCLMEFKEKIIRYQNTLEEQCRSPKGLSDFNSHYAKEVDAVNKLIDEYSDHVGPLQTLTPTFYKKC